jgi:hypothetical protein
VRPYNVLAASGYTTLAEVPRALRDDGLELMRKKNFGKKSLNDLWAAIEQLARPGAAYYQPSFLELPESLASLFPEAESETQVIAQSLSDYTFSRLEAAGVDPDQPWQSFLPVVPTRLRKVLEKRFVTLREVVIAATDGIDSLRKAKNFGQTSLLEPCGLLEKLVEHGPAYVRYGDEGGPPGSIDALITRALASLPEQDGRLLVQRFLGGATLEQLGGQHNLTRERMRQKSEKLLSKLRHRFAQAAMDLTGSLIEAAEHAGGLLHRDTALAITAADDLRRVWLALLIAGAESFQLWREEFLTTLKFEELSDRLRAVGHYLRENRKRDLALSDVGDFIAQASGLRLDVAGLSALLTHYFDRQITENKLVIPSRIKLSDWLERILRAAGRPMHISEIIDLHQASPAASGAEEIAYLNEDEGKQAALQSNESEGREITERALIAAIDRNENIYQCHSKTFVHADALPVPLERLNEIVDFRVASIEGEPGAIAATVAE